MSGINLYSLANGERDTWSWSHLKTFVGQDEAAEHFYAGASLQACLQHLVSLCSPCQDVSQSAQPLCLRVHFTGHNGTADGVMFSTTPIF